MINTEILKSIFTGKKIHEFKRREDVSYEVIKVYNTVKSFIVEPLRV